MSSVEPILIKIDIVKEQVNDNIQNAIKNCVQLDEIATKSEDLAMKSHLFRENARNIKNKMWWINCKKWGCIVSFVLFILLIITIIIISSKSNKK